MQGVIVVGIVKDAQGTEHVWAPMADGMSVGPACGSVGDFDTTIAEAWSLNGTKCPKCQKTVEGKIIYKRISL